MSAPSAAIAARARNALYGLLVGNAVGLPVDGLSRNHLTRNPVHGYTGHVMHPVGPGTWSAYGVTALALAECLLRGVELTSSVGPASEQWLGPDKAFAGDLPMTRTGRAAPFLAEPGSPLALAVMIPLALHTLHETQHVALCRARAIARLFGDDPATLVTLVHATALFRALAVGESLVAAGDSARAVAWQSLPSLVPSGLRPLFLASADRLAELPTSPVHQIASAYATALAMVDSATDFSAAVLAAANRGGAAAATGAIAGAVAGAAQGVDDHWLHGLVLRGEIDHIAYPFGDRVAAGA